jgi:hypothetical protein
MDLRLGLRELRSEPSRLDIAGRRDSQLARIFPKPFRIVREGFSHLVARADVSRFTGAAARYERGKPPLHRRTVNVLAFSTDRLAFGPVLSSARLQDIRLARISQELTKRFYNLLAVGEGRPTSLMGLTEKNSA